MGFELHDPEALLATLRSFPKETDWVEAEADREADRAETETEAREGVDTGAEAEKGAEGGRKADSFDEESGTG